MKAQKSWVVSTPQPGLVNSVLQGGYPGAVQATVLCLSNCMERRVMWCEYASGGWFGKDKVAVMIEFVYVLQYARIIIVSCRKRIVYTTDTPIA